VTEFFLGRFSMTSSNATRYSLIQNARSQSPSAWEQLVHIYTPLIQAWGRRLGCQSDEVDDLTQDVFQSVSSSIDSFRGDGVTGSFRGWLWRITYRKWIDRYRRDVHEAQAAGGSTAAHALAQIRDTSIDEPSEPSTSEMINGALLRATNLVRNEFQDSHWQAFWQSVIEGQSTELVSQRLSMTPAAVRQARSRILRRLRIVMGDLNVVPSPHEPIL
jgi:RNA polymerase sigma-70 factor (ECF subfamily)